MQRSVRTPYDRVVMAVPVTIPYARYSIESAQWWIGRALKSLGGPGGPGTNPEQLFAAGYAACFLGAVKLVARTRKITPSAEPTVTARVGMGPVAVGYALTVELKVLLPGLEKSVAEEVVAGAHERCPYSNATRGNIDVKLTVL